MWRGIFVSNPTVMTDRQQREIRLNSMGAMVTATENADGTPTGTLPAGTDRSGTANTTATTLAPANAARKGLEVQNVGANNIGINEIGGTAAIGAAGTYTVLPGGAFRVRTNRVISVIAATGATTYSATEY